MVLKCLLVGGVLLLVGLWGSGAAPNVPAYEKEREYWNTLAKRSISRRMNLKENNKVARNVILFLGDGMGVASVTAARILRGQLKGKPGEETVLSFENFPNVAFSKTYNVDRQTADSAAAGTAFLSGIKANFYTLGLDATATYDVCNSSVGAEVTTILDWAEDVGKATGIVTTARITHATPAAAYAHSVNRYWEGNVGNSNVTSCKDIARQLVEDNPNIEVLFGGGRKHFLSEADLDPEYNTSSSHRKDGRNLLKEWKEKGGDDGTRRHFVWNKEQFDNINPAGTDNVLGLFESSHMQYELDRNNSSSGEPSLAEMTKKAIEILRHREEGYFLLVEGARIDQAHHDNLAVKALHEVLAFDDAVQAALDMVNLEDTLVIVTADHASGLDITGYPYRGNDILGLVDPIDPIEEPLDKLPYSTLIYSSGPGYTSPRGTLDTDTLHDKEFAYPGAVPSPWMFHSGEDVAIYATGPMAHLFHSVHEQNYVAHVMAFSACIGPYQKQCYRNDNAQHSNSRHMFHGSTALLVVSFSCFWLIKRLITTICQ